MKRPVCAVFVLVLLGRPEINLAGKVNPMDNLWKLEAASNPLTNKIVYTRGGNARNARCVFPFTYKGKTYNECTRDGDAYKIEWCATTSSYDRDKKWGHCVKDKELRNCEDRHKNCEREALSGRCLLSAEVNRACSRSCGMCTFGGNAEGRPCVLPFIYRNKVSNECVEYENKRWCATTSNFDVDKKWGYCFPKVFANMTEVDARYLTFGECDDRDLKCPKWASNGQCSRARHFMETTCPWSCRKCAPPMLVNDHRCMDHSQDCEKFVNRGHCRKYPAFMFAFCRWSCRECTKNRPGSSRVKEDRPKCDRWARRGECDTNPDFMMAYCRRSCMGEGYVKNKKQVNKYAYCQEWARKGYCTTNPTLMQRVCPYSCALRKS